MGPALSGRPHLRRGIEPTEMLPLHSAQDRGDDDLADHGDRVDESVAERHARIRVGAAVREGEDGGLGLRATEQTGELRTAHLKDPAHRAV